MLLLEPCCVFENQLNYCLGTDVTMPLRFHSFPLLDSGAYPFMDVEMFLVINLHVAVLS